MPKQFLNWWPIWSERNRLLPWEAYPLRPSLYELYPDWPETDVLLAYRQASNPLSASRHTMLLLRKVHGGLRLEVAQAFFGYSSPGREWKLLREANAAECQRGLWRYKKRSVVFQSVVPVNKPRSPQPARAQNRTRAVRKKEFA